jgi:hypothetical protein
LDLGAIKRFSTSSDKLTMSNKEMENCADECMEHDNGDDDGMDQLEEKKRIEDLPLSHITYNFLNPNLHDGKLH